MCYILHNYYKIKGTYQQLNRHELHAKYGIVVFNIVTPH